MRKIEEIIIHCTATPEGRSVTVADIRRWHLRNGWKDIGYHWGILLDGKIAPGRPEEEAGAHCKGHNAHSIGVAYVGGCDRNMNPKDTRTAGQKTALEQLCRELLRRYPGAQIRGHNEYSQKACPSFDVQELRDKMK